MSAPYSLPSYLTMNWITQDVMRALCEDLGPDSHDLSADFLPNHMSKARIVAREPGILCGQPWAETAFRLTDPSSLVKITWHVRDGQAFSKGDVILSAEGPGCALLTAERTALNFLQLLSGTATVTRRYVDALTGYKARLLDTRKTIPGLRYAQKYAVLCGGGKNHRLGLYDQILLKENHIAFAGGITTLVTQLRARGIAAPVQIEVQNLDELKEALSVQVDSILLDNFSTEQLAEAVRYTAGAVPLEASGGVSLETLPNVARTGVDFISVGSITKHVQAIDLSFLFEG
ncbi:MAG: carboxylating nicotinate-nucleotide diphosphorylase [Pseudomonadota bacterium]